MAHLWALGLAGFLSFAGSGGVHCGGLHPASPGELHVLSLRMCGCCSCLLDAAACTGCIACWAFSMPRLYNVVNTCSLCSPCWQLNWHLAHPSLFLPLALAQDLKSLQSIKSKMAGGSARQSMALHAAGGPLGPSMLSRTSTPNVDLIKVSTRLFCLVWYEECNRWGPACCPARPRLTWV